jgi:hypothetical protein
MKNRERRNECLGERKEGFFWVFFFYSADDAGFGERKEFLGERKLAGDAKLNKQNKRIIRPKVT